MSKTETLTVHLQPGEACVVLDKKFWDHMTHWYTIMANETSDPNDKANWVSVIDEVSYWSKRTYNDPNAPEPEWELVEDDKWQ